MRDKPKFVTSCWFTKLPEDYASIGISRGVPRRRSGYRRYTALNPAREWFYAAREEFTQRHNEEILGVLKPELVVRELQEMAGGRIPVLLCWEHPQPSINWCHRSLVSVWLWEKLGLEVPEFGLEHEGSGWSHPKLHPDVRRTRDER